MAKILFGEDGKYEVGIGSGQWAKSIEDRKVEVGEVRLIGGVLMAAYTVKETWFIFTDWEVNWIPANEKENTMENLHRWRASL